MQKFFLWFLIVLSLSLIIFLRLPVQDESPQKQKEPVINFWGIIDQKEAYEKALAIFKERYPSVQFHYELFPSTNELIDVLKVQFQKGKSPDIFLFPAEKEEEFRSYLLPLILKTKDFPKGIFEKSHDFSLAAPLWVDSLMIYYNKRYYQQGIAENWYDFAEQTRKISIGGIALGRVDNTVFGWDALKALFLQKQITFSGKASNALYDTLEFFTRFSDPHNKYFNWNERLSKNYPDKEIDSFIHQNVAAIAGYSGTEAFLFQKIATTKRKRIIKKEDIGYALFPQLKKERPVFLGKAMMMGVSVLSPYPEESAAFIDALMTKEAMTHYARITGRMPALMMPTYNPSSEKQSVQKQQLPNVQFSLIPKEVNRTLEVVLEQAMDDRNALKKVLQLRF